MDSGISDLLLMESTTKFTLPQDVLVEITSWKGERRVDFRQLDANGYRTKFGIALNLSRFKNLLMCMDSLNNNFAEVVKGRDVDFEMHLGGNIYTYVKSPFTCVQIRAKYSKDGDMRYSYFKGISLKQDQWNSLVVLLPLLVDREDI